MQHPITSVHSGYAASGRATFYLLCCLMAVGTATAADDADWNALFADETPEQSAAQPETIELAEQPLPAVPPPSRRAGTLEEIVVTAQKREQGLRDVPISITAVGGDKLKDAGIENISDIAEYVPNFKLADSGLTPQVFMRGVGSGTNQGFEMSVGMYSDGVHLGRPLQTLSSFLDVERVEVLRGPQSALFGKNAIAGALNITSARPQEAFSGALGVSWFEPFSDGEIDGHLTGGLGDAVATRLAFRHRQEGGYLHNSALLRQEPGLDETAARLSFSANPMDAFGLYFKLEHGERNQGGRTHQLIDRGILSESIDAPFGLDMERSTDLIEKAGIKTDAATLQLDFPIGNHSLEFVSGYASHYLTDNYDVDAANYEGLHHNQAEDHSQWSQEIRFVSAPGDTFDYILGGFYEGGETDLNELTEINLRNGTVLMTQASPDDIDNLALLGEANMALIMTTDMVRDYRLVSSAWSVFGQFGFAWSPRWHTSLGLRYVLENKKGSRVLDTYQRGTQDPMNPADAAILSQLLIEPHQLSGDRDSEALLPEFRLRFDMTDNTMFFASWARGAKSGSFDARNNNAQPGPTGGGDYFEFDDEIADATELGTKLRLADGAAELNVSLYHVKYTNMQISVFDGVAGFAVKNAGSAQVQGVELDGRWLIVPDWQLSAALAYLDFEWQEYEEGPCHFGREPGGNGFCDFAGNENQQTPRWTGSISSDYWGELNAVLNWNAALDLNYRSEHYTSGDLDPRGRQPGSLRINARLAIADPGQRWSVALVGKNLTDELVGGVSAPASLDTGGYWVATERPRTYGLEMRYAFD